MMRSYRTKLPCSKRLSGSQQLQPTSRYRAIALDEAKIAATLTFERCLELCERNPIRVRESSPEPRRLGPNELTPVHQRTSRRLRETTAMPVSESTNDAEARTVVHAERADQSGAETARLGAACLVSRCWDGRPKSAPGGPCQQSRDTQVPILQASWFCFIDDSSSKLKLSWISLVL
ncbi:hypothetical protein HPB50_018818 [Hyalomma asiaticum]|uniref:Uncharacterized protein n=1 Tax=Hyalomma asiaticum TaxID=266040 RepID=A0ACB7SGB8_HYAAI|nr:hypothetical protein HPB50_018818 [Hyalomma asiaticum]